MDKNNSSDFASIEAKLPSTGQAFASTVMNGAGNGAMLGGLPLAATVLYHELTGKDMNKNLRKISFGITAVGAVVGAVYGWQEAKHVNDYRAALTSKIGALEQQVTENKAELASWKQRVTAPVHAHADSQDIER